MKKFKNVSLSAVLWLLFGQLLVSLLGVIVCVPLYFVYLDICRGGSHLLSEFLITAFGATLIIVILLNFSRVLSLIFIMLVAVVLLKWRGCLKLWPFLLLTPVSTVLLWYGYDRLVPDVRLGIDERPPYEHGITWARFGIAWVIEVFIVCGYWIPFRNFRFMWRG